MTRDDAMILLGLTRADGDLTAIHAAYKSIAATLIARAASALTPSLREKYEQQAARLREARDLLLGDATPSANLPLLSLTKQLDLPARTPAVTAPVTAPPAGAEHAASQLSLTPGRVLAERFEIRTSLGSGGMGTVFAAFDRVRGEEVALKVLLPHLLADPQARERFLNEARIASNLSHPNIVRPIDEHRDGTRHGLLHGAGAVAGQRGRPSRRPVCPGGRPL